LSSVIIFSMSSLNKARVSVVLADAGRLRPPRSVSA
jgi:hypothetical protein